MGSLATFFNPPCPPTLGNLRFGGIPQTPGRGVNPLYTSPFLSDLNNMY